SPFLPPSFFAASACCDFSACAGDCFFAPPMVSFYKVLFINEQKYKNDPCTDGYETLFLEIKHVIRVFYF
ncbi:MAG: hypothetical protein ACREAE_07625, partial [Nitrosopumilaceae archaeon]